MNAINLFEANIILWIQTHLCTELLTVPMQIITTLGNGGAFWIVLTVLMLLIKKTRRSGICCAVALLLDLLVVNIAIKPIIGRIRPYQVLEQITVLTTLPKDASFPSGHSAASFCAAWSIWRTLGGRRGGGALTLAFFIALSRLYVGVHYPSDVLCGAVIGLFLAEIAVRIMNRLSKTESHMNISPF